MVDIAERTKDLLFVCQISIFYFIDRRFCRKIALYRLKDLSTDAIGKYCMLDMSEGESFTSDVTSDEIRLRILLIALISARPEFFCNTYILNFCI